MKVAIAIVFMLVCLQVHAQNNHNNLSKTTRGFIPFFWSADNSKIYFKIDNLDGEFIYQTSLNTGLGSNDIGLDRGMLVDTRIVKFVKIANHILLVEPNYKFRSLSQDKKQKIAVEKSFAYSVLWSFKIESQGKEGYVIETTSFLNSDVLKVSNRLNRKYKIDPQRSILLTDRAKNFPSNTELEVLSTFVNEDGSIDENVKSVSPESNIFSLEIRHSFAKLPDNNYKPRQFDVRSGYYKVAFYDFDKKISSPIETAFITRHRLEKSNPLLQVSDAKKPIVYYLDNATPEPIKSALLEGAKWWNEAFLSAGYRNAFQVLIKPDSIDPMDIRYNVINWVHRSTRGWSYGGTLVDPRTGEIIRGVVTLESLRGRYDYSLFQGLYSPYKKGNDSNLLVMLCMLRLKQLAAHEIGHTLGIMHNFIASSQNRSSVMDYPHPMISLKANKIDFDSSYTNSIGEWDKIAIQYGYKDFADPNIERSGLNEILLAAINNGYSFITDRDARAVGGINPNAHLWDNGKDPVEELLKLMKIRKMCLNEFGEDNIAQGVPFAMLEEILVPVYMMHRYQMEATIKIIGGQDYSYSVKGDNQIVTSPIGKPRQIEALNAVIKCILPGNLALKTSIINLIPPQPTSYDPNKSEIFKRRTGLAFDPLSVAESATDLPISLLFNTERLNRMVEYNAIYGGLNVREMFEILFEKSWCKPDYTGLQKLIQMQNEQIILTYLLASYSSEEISTPCKAQLLSAIMRVKSYAERELKLSEDRDYIDHLFLILDRIKFPEKAKITQHPKSPQGSPLNCGMGF